MKQIAYEYTLAQSTAVMRQTQNAPYYKRMQWMATLGPAIALLMIGRYSGTRVVIAAALAAIGTYFTIELFNHLYVRKALEPYSRGKMSMRCSVELDTAGVTFSNEQSSAFVTWSDVKEARVEKTGVEVWSSRKKLLAVVPSAAFEGEEEMQDFVTSVNSGALS